MNVSIKTMLGLAILLTATAAVKAQDIITLKNGDDVKAKVIDIGTNEIKYKKWDNPDGPAYTLTKGEIFMIKYQNGTKDVFNTTQTAVPTPPPPANNPNYNNAPAQNTNVQQQVEAALKAQRAEEDYQKYNRLAKKRIVSGAVSTGIGGAFLIAGAGLLGAGASYALAYDTYDYGYGSGYGYDEEVYIPMTIIGAALVITAIPLLITGPIKLSKGIRDKKKANAARRDMELSLAPMAAPTFDRVTGSAGFQGGFGMKLKF